MPGLLHAIDRDTIAAIDSTDQLGRVLDMGGHLRDAWRRAAATRLPRLWAPRGLVVAGMGGSGIGGRLAVAALGAGAGRPVEVSAGYALPPWTGRGTAVLCSSYSGDTEETLSAYEIAGKLGASRVVATTGGELGARARQDGVPLIELPRGLEPRAAVAYSTVAALEVAARAGLGASPRSQLADAGALLDRLAREWGPDAPEDSAAKALARALHDRTCVVVGAGATAPVAYRWKCQLNENAKLPAFAGELPEIDHNEIVGWKAAVDLGRFAVIFLDDPEAHPRMRARIRLTAELLGDDAEVLRVLEPRGASRLERMLSLVLLGDLVSVYAAVLRGVDPVEIDILHELKAKLAALA